MADFHKTSLTLIVRALPSKRPGRYIVGTRLISHNYDETDIYEFAGDASSVAGATCLAALEAVHVANDDGVLGRVQNLSITHTMPEVCLALKSIPYPKELNTDEMTVGYRIRQLCNEQENPVKFRIVPCRAENEASRRLLSSMYHFLENYQK